MSFKRYTGSAWTDISNVKRYTGSAWTDCDSVKRYNGSAWVDVWTNAHYLFKEGAGLVNEFSGGVSARVGTLSVSASCIQITGTTSSSDDPTISLYCRTAGMINTAVFKNFSNLYYEYALVRTSAGTSQGVYHAQNHGISFSTSATGSLYNGTPLLPVTLSHPDTPNTVQRNTAVLSTADILSGSYYVYLGMTAAEASNSGISYAYRIYNIYLK